MSNASLGSFFWTFYKPYKGAILIIILCAAMVGLHGLINSYLTKIVIDTLNSPDLLMKRVLFPALFIVMNFEIHNICWRVIDYINLKKSPEIKNEMIHHVFNHVHGQSERFFQDTLSGSIANNIMILSENMERIASNLSIRLIRGGVQLIGALIVMYFIHPVFSAALFLWVLCFVSISLVFSKKISAFSDDFAKSQSHVSGTIVDSVSNFSNVKLFARKTFESSFLERTLKRMKETFRIKEWFLIKFYFFQGFSITCLIGVIVYFLLQLKMSGQVTIGDFAFILGASLYVTENVWGATEQIDQLNEALGKCRQCLKALFTPIEIKDKEDVKSINIKEGRILFDQVFFHYDPKAPLFKNKSVEIFPGQKVGLVGYSGSGKSTFVNLLLRLYDVTEGRILIDGQDIRDVNQHTLRSSIGIIPQSPSLFHRSLMENIRYGQVTATDEEVIEAAKRANVHEFVSSLPMGYDSLIGERGIKLSGGQRQRVAIARVVLKNAPILILDEATSQLDSITENTIKQSLREMMIGKTTIVIAHRLSTLLNMDRILVFDQGKIIEDGTHQDLLDLHGHYKALWDAQVGEFLPNTP